MYLANHYVRINGKMLKRGEKIPEGLPQGKIEWLLSAGAIKEIAPASLGEPEEVPEDTEDATEDAEDAAQQAEGEEPGTSLVDLAVHSEVLPGHCAGAGIGRGIIIGGDADLVPDGDPVFLQELVHLVGDLHSAMLLARVPPGPFRGSPLL